MPHAILISLDYNEESGGVSFKDSLPDWRDYKLVKDFSKWAYESFGACLFCPKKMD
jgi:hypothetical protein